MKNDNKKSGASELLIAKPGRRVMAFIIDVLIVYTVAAPMVDVLFVDGTTNDVESMFAAVATENIEAINKVVSNSIYQLIAKASLLMAVMAILFAVMWKISGGRSVGKKIFKIRIVRDDDGEISFSQALLRSALTIMSVFTFFAGHMGMFKAGEKAIPDTISRTKVVLENI